LQWFLYIVKGNRAAAKRELQRLRGKDADERIAQEMAEMEAEANAKVQTSSFCDVLRDPRLTLPLIIVCCFHGGQQLSGINAVSCGPVPTLRVCLIGNCRFRYFTTRSAYSKKQDCPR